MQWSALTIILVGVAIVEGTWKRGQEYNYKVTTKTLKNEKWDVFEARFTIRPESDEMFIGKLTQVQTSTIGAVLDMNNWNNNNLRIEEPFKVKVKNGVVETLMVNRQWSEYQRNQLKYFVNTVVDKVYIDRNVQCQMDGESAFYNMREKTMLGDCETIYEVSPLAGYLVQSSRDLVPLPDLRRERQFTDVVKSRDYNKCTRSQNTGSSPNPNRESTLIEVNRVIISGPLTDYTIQSSFSTLKATERLNGLPNTISYVNITLESVNANAIYPTISIDNLMDIQNFSPSASPNNDGRIQFAATRQALLPCTSKHEDFKQLTITPSFVSIVGHTPITLEGPPLNDSIRVQIRFHDTMVKTVTATISGSKVTCMVPYLQTNGRVQVDMVVTRANTVVDTYYGFIYTQKHRSEMRFELLSSTRIKMTWDKTKFATGAPLTLELLELVEGDLTSRGVIKSNITNNGLFLGDLDMMGVTIVQQLRNLYVVKLEAPLQLRSMRSVAAVAVKSVIISDFLHQLSAKSQTEIDQMCYDWYMTDKGAPTDALPCPPTLQKARVDERFAPVDDLKLYNPDAEFGFMQRVPSTSGAAQRCVYKGGKLLVGPPSGGNVRKVSPNGEKGETAHIIADIIPWYLCCNNNKANCNLYYEKRPSNDGRDYRDCHNGIMCGDPHITTFDGLYYTFLGLGEFWVIRSQDDTFSMQGRFTQLQNSKATVATAYVMRHRSTEGVATVQLSLKNGYIEVMIDGHIVAMGANQPARTIAHKGAFITLNSQQDIRVTFASGHSFKFTYYPVVINMIGMLDVNLKNSFKGLFGNFDGNQQNELTYPNGKVIPKNSNARNIHDYGMSWKIDCHDSLFTYPSDKGYESFYDDKYVPHHEVLDRDKLPPKAKEVCGDIYECLFDFTITGSVEIATSTKTAVDEFISITQSLGATCPRMYDPMNGYLQAINFAEGSIVKVVCNDNFGVQGSESITCVRNNAGDLYWQGTLGQCAQKNKCANENSWLQWLCEHGLPAP